MSCETLEDYRNSAEELEQYPEKIVGVHSADIDWEDEAAWKCLEENADGDTSLVFCGLPEAGRQLRGQGGRCQQEGCQ
jgi:hypothetical protein